MSKQLQNILSASNRSMPYTKSIYMFGAGTTKKRYLFGVSARQSRSGQCSTSSINLFVRLSLCSIYKYFFRFELRCSYALEFARRGSMYFSMLVTSLAATGCHVSLISHQSKDSIWKTTIHIATSPLDASSALFLTVKGTPCRKTFNR